MELISPTDSMFLLAESREHPMHVGGLQLFEPPPDDMGPEFLAEIYNDLLTYQDVQPTFRKHPPGALFGGIANLTWAFDRDIDLEYHLRRSALPKPGRVRELLELTSRLHGSLLDRHRPLWETHLVEGLNDGRVAVYTKIHHSLLDGVSAMKLTKRTLSPDPQDEEIRAPWTIGPRARNKEKKSGGGSPLGGLVRAAGSVAGLAPRRDHRAWRPLRTAADLAVRSSQDDVQRADRRGARRVAAQSWPLKRIIAIKEAAAGVTVNDVILAMCAGALRAYLIEQDALPDKPLIAMVPVNLRDDNDPSSGGNQVGAILCSLATDQSDPAKRLEAIHDSISGNKEVFLQLPKMQQLALSAFNMAPLALTLLPALAAAAAPPFNIVISNVPGAREPLYWHGGARLDGNYPLSIALDGQALNITMSNNADNLDFGLVGCRRSIPHLQRLLTQLEDSLAALEKAVGGV